MTHTVEVFQTGIFQSGVYDLEYKTPQVYQSGIYDATTYDSGRELKSIVNESIELILKQFQSNAFDPSNFQGLQEAITKLVRILIIDESINVQAFRGTATNIARIISENV